MKYSIAFIITIFINISFSQVPNLEWARFYGGSGIDESYGLAIDQNENVITCGIFNNTVDFDPSSGILNLSAPGSFNAAFIQKLNDAGELIWTKSYGGTNDVWAKSIATDINNNIYITGHFQGTIDFDPGPGVYNLSPSGFSDAYFMKLNENGIFQWAYKLGGINDDTGFDIAVDSNNDIIVTGDFTNTADFDPSSNIYNLTTIDGSGSFVLKIDSNANFIWANTINTNTHAISIDKSNNILLTGVYGNTVDFDPSSLGNYNLSSISGTADIYILKLNPAGQFIFANSIGGNLQEVGGSICTDSYNNIYLTGGFSGLCDFDPSSNNFDINSNGNLDIFITKMDSLGNLIWANAFGSNGVTNDFGNGINCDIFNNVYLTGCFSGTVDFNNSTQVFNLSSNGLMDVFTLKLGSDGTFKWATSHGGSGISDSGSEVLINNNTSSIYISGVYGGVVDLDPDLNLILNTVAFSSSNDCFIQKLKNCIDSSNLTIAKCGQYTTQDNQVLTNSGLYNLFIPNHYGCDSVITLNLTIFPLPNISGGMNYEVCENDSITLSGSGGDTYSWSNGIINGESFVPSIGNNTYTIIGTDNNGCSNSDQISVFVNPLPDISFSIDDSTGCMPFTVNLTNTSSNSINCSWQFSNGVNINQCNTVNTTFNEQGCFNVTLNITDTNGCNNILSKLNAICIDSLPIANFNVSENYITSQNNQINFINNSTNATSFIWNFGDSSSLSYLTNPSHTYINSNQNSYQIELIALSNNECADTMYLTIYNKQQTANDIELFIPTGLSPNNDNENDNWTVIGLEKYPNVKLFIYNRWGQLIFEGNQSSPSWNGKYNGETLPTADYYYIVEIGDGRTFNGVVTLKQ
jgi:gliding motility-associated-like protein